MEKDMEKVMDPEKSQDPFGAGEEVGGVRYRTMKWWNCAVLMIAQSVSLGVLSLPSSMATLGLVPGCIIIIGIGALTTYTGYVVGQFKLRYPQVHNMSDASEILFGAWGREIFGVAQILCFIFLMGAHILTFSIMMNDLTNHGACTIIFCLVGAILCFMLTLSRRLEEVSYLGIISSLSVFTAVMITMIAIGIERPNPVAYATTHPTLINGFSATLNIVLAYSGHMSFFSFQSELIDPTDYPKALIAFQATDTTLYIITALVIYRYAGPGVLSPALLSASEVVSKVAFGISIGTIVIAGVVICHVGAKCIYVRLFRGTHKMNEKSFRSYGTWVLITFLMWAIAWLIANAIPVFNDLLNMIAAAFCSWFSFGLEGLFWLHMNRGQYFSSKRKIALTVLNVFLVALCCLICGMGLWATGTSIRINAQTAHKPFSCASNA
ncbi:Amino acid transporter transmembrane [Penicillium angulare]|uniref:Amino acid transporter transmembrane n=1 Tax=Penicillium angulare TaxID=116970 RepID=UPI002540301D|nr:Amino acid transporter transmembrane [Penicillium angulare]KAJ5273383.1 Amino acid transporter transmembrane [Penicillium angulare]